MAARLWVSLPLALGAIVVACLIALPLGIFAALRFGTPLDPLIVSFAQFGAAVPSFWLGLMLILLFQRRMGLASGGRLRPLGARLCGDVEEPAVADPGPGARSGGGDYPDDARGDARDAVPGLYPHRPGQGGTLGPRGAPSRAP